MLKISRTTSRTAIAITALVAMIAVKPIAAHADEVNIAGNASGYFNAGGTTLAGLEYFGSSFNGTSAGGFIGFGGATGVANNNFGMLRLDSADPATYFGNTFTLNLAFSAPSGITGGNIGTYNAAVQGVVTSDGRGGAALDFDNSPLLFTFLDGTTQGSFKLAVNDVALYPEMDNTISGIVTDASQTVIPEPGTIALVAAGLLPLAGGIVRRRRTA